METKKHIETVLFLRDLDLFKYFRAEEVFELAHLGKWVSIKDTEVFRDGEKAKALYGIYEGKILQDFGPPLIRTLKRGQAFGHWSILSGRLRQGTAYAEGEVILFEIPAHAFVNLLSDNFDVIRALFQQLTDRFLFSGE